MYFVRVIMMCVAVCIFSGAVAQQLKPVSRFIDLTGTVGASQGTVSLSYVHNWRTGKKFELGVGGRWTTYMGTKKEFYTAGPASLTRTFSFPVAIVFAGIKEENIDTLVVQRPLINALNLSFNAGYHFSKRFYGGVNIDVIGVSFGRKSSSVLTSNGESFTERDTRPTPFNLLLTGDHDRGTLNSEFFLRYTIGNRWGIRALYQFVFAEYRTVNVKQVAPDGTEVDRFRNKANNIGLGVTYMLN